MIRVLHIEARPIVAARLRARLAPKLNDFELELEHADTPEQALARIDAARARPHDVVLLGMPRAHPHDLDLLAGIRARVASAVLIVLFDACDAATLAATLAAALAAGADDYARDAIDELARLPNLIRVALERKRRTEAASQQPVRVLYVGDDVEAFARAIAKFAHPFAHVDFAACTTPGEAAEALAGANASAATFDLIVLDQAGDALEHIDAVKAIRDRSSLDLPVIVVAREQSDLLTLAASRLEVDVLRISAAGELDELPAAIAQLHARAELARERAQLRESEARLRALIDHSPALISLTDAHGNYLAVNRRFAEAIGTAPELVVGQCAYDLFPDRYANVFAEHALRVVRGARSISAEESFPFAGGELSYYTTRFPIYGADGTLVATGAIATDITALRRAEAELTRLNTELELRVSERTSELYAVIRELESFAHTIAHDLRAPARAMSGFASVLLSEPQLCATEEGRRMLQRIERNALHMQQLIEDLLQMARAGNSPLKRGLTDLSALAREALDLTHAQHTDRTLAPAINALGHARVDPGLFRQVFANLIGNALKFSGARRDAMIEVGRLVQDGEPVWFVRDNGVGFDMRYADRLFRAFQRLHPHEQFEGSGIGLAHTARIVERHGGRIWADAEPGKGATFYFTIGG